ncbi:MAG: hypothetical protein AB7F71_21935, partial [Burkholderiaceae bacterium]
GVVFPSGSNSVLFIGRHGTGTYCYGEGGENGVCYDPAVAYKGPHAYPYRYQIWAYDANDLADVKAGKKLAYELQPYSTWAIDLPYEASSNSREINGVAYDPSSRTMYLSQGCVSTACVPLIHALRFVL